MIPVQCRVPHRPDQGLYGDCVRACVASLLEVDAEAVPHFCHDNPTAEVMWDRMQDYLRGHGLAPFVSCHDDDPREMNGENHPDVHYMLFGSTGEADHVVICKGDKVVHNPSWYGGGLLGPTDMGYWMVVVMVKL